MLWDSVALTNIQVLKGHKDEIRCACVIGNYLISAGGGQHSSALLIWDLRTMTCIEEREKGKDVFSLLPLTNDQFLFGARNHYLQLSSIKDAEDGGRFEPPHYDTVTAIGLLGDSIVSGCRD